MLMLSESFAQSFEPKCYIIKVSNFCNLTCTYCYYYGSEGFNGSQGNNYPDFISGSTLYNLFSFARRTAGELGVEDVQFCWYGGEPMCVPIRDFREMLEMQRGVFGSSSSIKLNNTIQTNATRLPLTGQKC
ncbi:MAG: hypothetical protein H7843_07750 [Nitrospirota bacterium]